MCLSSFPPCCARVRQLGWPKCGVDDGFPIQLALSPFFNLLPPNKLTPGAVVTHPARLSVASVRVNGRLANGPRPLSPNFQRLGRFNWPRERQLRGGRPTQPTPRTPPLCVSARAHRALNEPTHSRAGGCYVDGFADDAAELTARGSVIPGDHILAVAGRFIDGKGQRHLRELLKEAPDPVVLLLRREPHQNGPSEASNSRGAAGDLPPLAAGSMHGDRRKEDDGKCHCECRWIDIVLSAAFFQESLSERRCCELRFGRLVRQLRRDNEPDDQATQGR